VRRSLCLVFTTCAQWLGQFVVVYSTPFMIAHITYGTFLFFGSMTVIAFFFVLFLLPETKGVKLEDMEVLFGPGTSVRAWRRREVYEEVLQSRETGTADHRIGEKGQSEARVENGSLESERKAVV
jgi:hypothetical protein